MFGEEEALSAAGGWESHHTHQDEASQNTKNRTTYDPVGRLQKMYPKTSASYYRDLQITLVDGLLRIAGMWISSLPIGEQIRKMGHMYTILISRGEIRNVQK